MPTPIKISASRGASILGMSKWSTPVETWLKIMEQLQPGFCEKNKHEVPVRKDSAPFRFGKAFEGAICDLVYDKYGEAVEDRELFCEHPDHDFITCHLDGKLPLEKAIIENKTTNARTFYQTWGDPGTGQVPEDYQIQAQHQMLITGYDRVFTGYDRVIMPVLVFPTPQAEIEKLHGGELERLDSSLFGNSLYRIDDLVVDPFKWARTLHDMGMFHIFEIKQDPEAQEAMLKLYKKFWTENVLGETPPEPKDFDDVRKLFHEPRGSVVATPEILELSKEFKSAKLLAKKTEDEIERLKEKLTTMAKDSPGYNEDKTKSLKIYDADGNKIHSLSKSKIGRFTFK